MNKVLQIILFLIAVICLWLYNQSHNPSWVVAMFINIQTVIFLSLYDNDKNSGSSRPSS